MSPKDKGRREKKPAQAERNRAGRGTRTEEETHPIDTEMDLPLYTDTNSTSRTTLGSHSDDLRPFGAESGVELTTDTAGKPSSPRIVGSARAIGANARTNSGSSSRGSRSRNRGNGANSPNNNGPRPGSSGDELQRRKRKSQDHEKFVARALNGRTTSASGALGDPGDVDADPFRIECKDTGGRTYRIRLVEIEKIHHEAAACERTPAMAFRFRGLDADVEQDWIMLPIRVLATLLPET
jgi:hypothetical protein